MFPRFWWAGEVPGSGAAPDVGLPRGAPAPVAQSTGVEGTAHRVPSERPAVRSPHDRGLPRPWAVEPGLPVSCQPSTLARGVAVHALGEVRLDRGQAQGLDGVDLSQGSLEQLTDPVLVQRVFMLCHP